MLESGAAWPGPGTPQQKIYESVQDINARDAHGITLSLFNFDRWYVDADVIAHPLTRGVASVISS